MILIYFCFFDTLLMLMKVIPNGKKLNEIELREN